MLRNVKVTGIARSLTGVYSPAAKLLKRGRACVGRLGLTGLTYKKD